MAKINIHPKIPKIFFRNLFSILVIAKTATCLNCNLFSGHCVLSLKYSVKSY